MSSVKLSHESRQRLQTMVETNDGFEIAEADMRLRGAGDLEGTRQSGILDLKLADIVRDEQMLRQARFMAQKILDNDPQLEKLENQRIVRHLNYLNSKKSEWAMIS